MHGQKNTKIRPEMLHGKFYFLFFFFLPIRIMNNHIKRWTILAKHSKERGVICGVPCQ